MTPVTGTYVCTNCQDQNSSINGIELNNVERTFNMLLTTADGNTNISIQALVGILVDTQLLVNESCTSNGQYTFCVIKSGENLTTEPITWTGVHRYTAEGSESAKCSGISGVFEYTSSDFGSIKGEFNSDKTCPNTTYFVSPSGNDTNTGISPQDAWQSISKINSIDLKPGDAVLFEGNNSYNGNIYLDDKDGNNSANAIKISSYGTGKATINAGSRFGIYAYNTSGIIIDNLIIAGNGMNTNTNSGIQFYNDLAGNIKLDFIEITNSEVYGFKDFGIVIGAWNENSGFSNVLIENNKVHDILDMGISSYGKFSSTKTGYAHSNITVRNCEVYNIKGYSKNSHSGNGIVLSDVQNSTIEHCTVYNSGSGNTNCGGPVGIWYWDADQVTIQFSEAYNISSGTGCDGGGFDMDGGVTNGIMQYNYSHDNDGSGFLVGQFTGARPMQNITVRYNISQNDAGTNGGSVSLFNGQNSLSMKDIYVYNNTFYLSEQATNTNSATIKYTLWKPVSNNINFYNNILFAENGADLIDVPSGYAGNFAGNLYYTSGIFRINYNGNTYNSLENFRGTGNETFENFPVGYQGKPMLTSKGNGGIIGFDNKLSSLDAYKLKADSPALNAGISFSLDRGPAIFMEVIYPKPAQMTLEPMKKYK
ncbi:MAG: right-handed parallel beta-helix repeat-containing protein [Flavobacteriaceae bacterium]|nr:right-handed parallel beta-helix repeat-containing protein [Flavobacteriaceae bacterium]